MIIAQSNGMCLGNTLNGKTWPTYCTEKWVPTAEIKSCFMTWMILLDALLWDAPTSTPVNISLLTLEWRLGLFLKEFSLEPMFLSNDHKISPELILCAVNKCNVTKVCDCRSSQKIAGKPLSPPFLINRGTNLEKFGEFVQDKWTEGATPAGRSPSQGAPCLNPWRLRTSPFICS